ncbi:hypothetical protein CL635_00020 [bacterium]|nr:hypothetical protein [bacterium]|tara:strand:+ start:749 stop:1090 length:342 start_codon:yes stop_codon:yes gene_type:complete
MSTEISIEERGAQIYDELMDYLGAPELKTANLASLKEEHEGESPIDQAARFEKYDAVFAEAERLIELRKLGQDIAIHDFLNDKRSEVLEHEAGERDEDVSKAEQELESFDDAV